ncbi:MAG: thioredoxin family protein [Prevotellaceae bacterium]|nr:thioredoxin family protein [Prevotellaceae bacterium]
MRKRIATIFACMLIALSVSAQNALKKVYDEDINPIEQVEKAVATAKSEGKFVLCQVGGNWCPWCLIFADFAETDSVVNNTINDNFIYRHVNYNPRKIEPNKAELAKALMERLGNPARFGFPVFVVLDGEGKVLHIQDSSFLEEGKGYSQQKVVRFLKNWTPAALSK